MAEILLADDERVARTVFRDLLEGEGHVVRLSRNGEEAVAEFRARRPDLVLLDVTMPKKGGIAACAEIRALDALVPILFFTAMPSEVTLVRGLGQGGDDYIPKDRPPEEFLARIARALRRGAATADACGAASPSRAETLALGATRVDFGTMAVTHEGGRETLTRAEMQALRLIAAAKGDIVDYAHLSAAFGGEGYRGSDEAVRKVVQRLRQKLGRGGALIVGVRGIGYRLVT